MKYNLIRTCKDCKNQDIFEFTKIQAAFELYNSSEIWKMKCSKCNSTNCYCIEHPYVKLDQEIFDLWGNNEHFFLSSQDEEIILAEMDNFSMILSAIKDEKYLNSKISILVESLCILLYDNTVECIDYNEEENQERAKNAQIIRPELIKIKDLIKANEVEIMDYLKVVVFPQLGIV